MSNYNKLNLPEDFEQQHINEVKVLLRSGNSKEDVVEILFDILEDNINDNVEDVELEETITNYIKAMSPVIIEKAMLECLEEQKQWPEITDCDKLTKAFKELSSNGIVAKENFTCCQTCGSSEISDYAEKQDYGYVFYHQQDTERAVEGGGVYLSYGHIGLAKKSMKELTEQIMKTLEKNELKVIWNGQTNTRMLIELDWKKRIV